MTLGQKQRLFTKLIAELILWAYEQGYEISLDWAYRPPAVAELYAKIGIGIRSSLHTSRLAIDLMLFRNGVWLSATPDHLPIGEKWETMHPLCRWGGRFGDGNHYSLTHGGVK